MNKKALLLGVFFPLLMGSTALLRTLNRPSMANVRAVDITTLLGAGMCFGAALVALIAVLRRKF